MGGPLHVPTGDLSLPVGHDPREPTKRELQRLTAAQLTVNLAQFGMEFKDAKAFVDACGLVEKYLTTGN